MGLVDGFTVSEAAEALAVSRVRVQHMISNGLLPAERIGNRWIIPRHEVFRAQRLPRRGGRPLTAERCWQHIQDVCAGHLAPVWLAENWSRLNKRARHEVGRILPEVLPEVYDDPRVRLGGAHAAAVTGVAIRPFQEPLDIYVSDELAEAYKTEVGFRSVASEPNVTIHAVPRSLWAGIASEAVVALPVAYLDLMEAGDRAASEVLRYLQGQSR